MINTHFNKFYQHIALSPLSSWINELPKLLTEWQQQNQDSRMSSWLKNIELIPEHNISQRDLINEVKVTTDKTLEAGQLKRLDHLLMSLSPWRKGPFSLFGLELDAEWRSDHKWNRLLPHIQSLKDKHVLDVGCNSGYHMFRMLGAEASTVIGIDPTPIFFCQFLAIQKLLGLSHSIYFLPLGIEQLPQSNAFDSVFSMGVLYHRRSPFDHLIQLKNQLNEGGELILETLVINGDENTILVPKDRYAKMRNVYFIPSINAMLLWLNKVGFQNINVVDVSITDSTEQRKTRWMTTESLADFLDPTNQKLTVEGYPAPMRAIFTAKK